ncbi:MAG TPA: hypothetical protein VF068_03670 [Rubrobacter sp.]
MKVVEAWASFALAATASEMTKIIAATMRAVPTGKAGLLLTMRYFSSLLQVRRENEEEPPPLHT